jgi:twitching motility two-component system response regulator PilG
LAYAGGQEAAMGKKRVLIVEDEESLLDLQTILLTIRGYDVVGVRDGMEALAEIGRRLPDLVLLDIMLPGMDGFEVCRRIRANPHSRGLPVVMLTAKKGGSDREEAMAAGASAYITKPFKSSQVIDVVREMLAHRTER